MSDRSLQPGYVWDPLNPDRLYQHWATAQNTAATTMPLAPDSQPTADGTPSGQSHHQQPDASTSRDPRAPATDPEPGLPSRPKRRSTHKSALRANLASQPHHTPLSFCDGQTVHDLLTPGNGIDPDHFFGAPALYLGLHVKVGKVIGLLNNKLRAEGATDGLFDEKDTAKPFHKRREFALKHLFGADNYAWRSKEYKAAQQDEVLREQYIEMLRTASTYEINPASTCILCKKKPTEQAGDVGISGEVSTPSDANTSLPVPSVASLDAPWSMAGFSNTFGHASPLPPNHSLAEEYAEPTSQQSGEPALKRRKTKRAGGSKSHQNTLVQAEIESRRYSVTPMPDRGASSAEGNFIPDSNIDPRLYDERPWSEQVADEEDLYRRNFQPIQQAPHSFGNHSEAAAGAVEPVPATEQAPLGEVAVHAVLEDDPIFAQFFDIEGYLAD